MEPVQFTSIHWVYIIGVLVVVATMILRKNVIIPCLLFTFIVGLLFKGDIPGAVGTLFTASVVAATELFSIFFIIAIMVTLLKALKVTGSDEVLARPMQGFMKSPLTGYIAIIIGTVFFSLLFWPTPAIPLIGALLIPAAIRAGLHPMVCAIGLALAGQGMSLAGDVIIQGAPGLTATSAGVPIEAITLNGGILTVITGAVAITLAWFLNRKDIKEFAENRGKDISEYLPVLADNSSEDESDPEHKKFNNFGAIFMLLIVVGVVVSMFVFDIKGGDAAGLLGGAALIIIATILLLTFKQNGLDKMADFIGEGLSFAFKIMGPIIPIAGFFFIGSPEAAPAILGEGAPGYLFDIGSKVASIISPTGIVACFGILILGMITGLDGSGFSGLPVVGTLAAALAAGDQASIAKLASIGQMGSIWSGGGTLVAWSSLVAVAGIVGVPVLDLVRRNFIPVMAGLFVSTMFALIFM